MSDVEETVPARVRSGQKDAVASAFVRKHGLERAMRAVAVLRRYQGGGTALPFVREDVELLLTLERAHVSLELLTEKVKAAVAEALGSE